MPIQLVTNGIVVGSSGVTVGHLQLVRNNLEIEVQPSSPLMVPLTGNGGEWDVTLNGDHSGTTNFFGLDGMYASIEVTWSDGRTEDEVWRLLQDAASSIDQQSANIPYFNDMVEILDGSPPWGETQNSNSFINTVMSIAGLSVFDYATSLSALVDYEFHPGVERNVLFDGHNIGSLTGVVSLALEGGDGKDIIRSGLGDDSIDGGAGDDLLISFGGQSNLAGGAGQDLVVSLESEGGSIEGGAGNDVLFSSASASGGFIDTVGGGLGSDFAYSYFSDVGVQIDTISYPDIEGFAGTEFMDEFTSSRSGIVYFSGGVENDIFRDETEATMVVFGGGGADQIHFEYGSAVLVMNVSGLTEGNFHSLDLTDTGIYDGPEITEFDVVLVNPEDQDEYYVGGVQTGETNVGAETVVYSLEEYYSVVDEFGIAGDPILLTSDSFTYTFPATTSSTLANIDIGSLEDIGAFTGLAVNNGLIVRETDSEQIFYQRELTYDDGERAQALANASWTTEYPIADADLSISFEIQSEDHADQHFQEWRVIDGGDGQWDNLNVEIYQFFDPEQTINQPTSILGPWGIVGGYFENDVLKSNGEITATLPSDAIDVYERVSEVSETSFGGTGEPNGPFGPSEKIRLDNDANLLDLSGTSEKRRIEALGGNDRIYDGEGNDAIYGGDGQDRLYAGAGSDHFDGGAATNDWVYYDRTTSGVVIDMSGSGAGTGIAAGDTFVDVERVTGSDHADIIIMGGAADQATGGYGDDLIIDNAGLDQVWGGAGADTFRFLVGDGERDQIRDFEFGTDIIDVSEWGATSIADLQFTYHSNGHVTIADLANVERILVKDIGTNTFDYTDFQFGVALTQTVDGTSGNDVIDANFTDADGETINGGSQVILGGDGNDTITAGAGNDTIYGGDGQDRFFGNDGADVYDGGTHHYDEINYSQSSIGLTIDMVNGANSTGMAAGDTFVNIERIQGTNYDDVIYAGDGVSIFNARNGDDLLVDGIGFTQMKGGNGADTFRILAGDGEVDRIDDFKFTDGDIIDIATWGATQLSDLTFADHATSGLQITYGAESIRLIGLDMTDVATFAESDFIFV